MSRADSFGFFWNDTPPPIAEKKARVPVGPRPRPEIPDNGWKPKPFPRLEGAKLIGFDTETKDLDLEEKGPGVRRDGHIIGLSVAVPEGETWYFPMRHEVDSGLNIPPENVLAWAKDELTRPNQPKVGLNLLYDLDYMAEAGVNVAGPFYDVGVAEALLDENAFSYDLDSISHRHLGVGKNSAAIEEWVWAAYQNKNFRAELYRSPSNLAGPYAEADAMNPLRIFEKQLPMLHQQGLDRVWDIEHRLTPLLLAMRRRGVRVDLAHVDRVEAQLTEALAEAHAKLKATAGFEVNVDEKPHLIKIFDQLGLTYPRTAPTARFPEGQPSFVKEFLEHHPHEIPKLITKIRRLERFKGTFVESYIRGLHINGRIHCLFNQVRSDDFGAVSGRFSSSLPNLQNIPKRDKFWGPLMRAMFIPEAGHRWRRLDWSQIEYRFLVHIAYTILRGEFGTAEAVERYRNDPKTDYHNFVSEITAVERDHAKNINFGFVYGMGAPLLASELGLTLDAAQPIFDQYHSALPFVKEIRDYAAKKAGRTGLITTILGRRRRFELWQPRYGDNQETGLPLGAAIGKWGHRLRRAYTHKALNAEIQGSAADLMKLAMVEAWDAGLFEPQALGIPHITCHDELGLSEAETPAAHEAADDLKRLMETCMTISVPIIADSKLAANWGEAK